MFSFARCAAHWKAADCDGNGRKVRVSIEMENRRGSDISQPSCSKSLVFATEVFFLSLSEPRHF